MRRLRWRCPVHQVWRALAPWRVDSVPVDSVPVDSVPVDSVPVVSEGWRSRELLTGADLSDFIALRRVCGRSDSHVTQVGEGLYDGERPLLCHVEDGVRMLIEVGFATLGEPDPECGRQPVTVTPEGRARYEDLCQRQGYPPYPGPASPTEGWQL